MRTNSSGMKRGLATVAVSALAVTGLPFLMSSASANTITEQAGAATEVVLVSPNTNNASVKNDGHDTSVRLVARGGADVQQVRFEYRTGVQVTYTTIATVGRTNGAFFADWTPPATLLNDPNTRVRAVGVSAGNTDLTNDEQLLSVRAADQATNAIDIATGAGTQVGLFQQPYAGQNHLLGAISGTSSDLSDNPTINVAAVTSPGTFRGEDVVEPLANGATTRGWSAAVEFDGYTFDAGPNEALVYARAAALGSDDAEAVTVYQQQIGEVTVTAQPASVQGAQTSTGVVKVVDQNGAPVVGAEVVQEGGVTLYTNSKGEARFPGLAGSPAGVQHFFYVNTTDVDAYENNVDFRRSVTVQSYTPAATSLTANSVDGAAFDDDEFAAGDITVTVKDQNNNPLAGETVNAAWTVTPFAITVGYPKTVTATVTDNGDGTYNVSFPAGEPSGTYALKYYINTDGTPGQQAGDPTGPDLVVKAGDSALTWDAGATAQAPAFGTATFKGSLKLEDGTALAGRNLALTWTKNGAGNVVVANQAAQPAGTTRTGDTSANATTGADGSFGIALVDLPTPDADELNGTLQAVTVATPGIGNAAETSPNLDVDFLKNAGPSTPNDITINVQNLIDGKATPGRPVDLDIDVENSDDVDLADYPVTIKVDHGFLSPNAEADTDLVADPAAADGAAYGEWKSDGVEKDYTTNDTGDTGAVVAIENDPGFATSDTVTTTVTVTAGTVTKTVAIPFKSIDPLNGGEVRVALAADADQSVSVLPKAPTTESVKYDLFVEDQFGNLVKGESVNLTDNLAGAAINGSDAPVAVNSQLENEAPAVTLSSTTAGSQTVSAEWKTESNTWKDGNAAPGFQPARDTKSAATATPITGTAAAVDWYAIDYASSDYAMTNTGGARLDVGDTTTVTYKAVDQNGEPIQGLQVNFFRTGPDNLQDGEGKPAVITNANGEAQYTFAGTKRGTAIVAAVVREPLPSTTIIEAAGETHSVSFGPSKLNPNARISRAKSDGDKDVLTVKANPAARGAKVIMYAAIGGEIVKVGQGRLNSEGTLVLKVKDRNGKKVTQYAAIVRSTSRTVQDTTKPKGVR